MTHVRRLTISGSQHDGKATLVDIQLSTRDAFALAMNLLSGCQANMKYAESGSASDIVALSLSANVSKFETVSTLNTLSLRPGQQPKPDEVWVVYLPHDYQRATIYGVFKTVHDAQAFAASERDSLRNEGEMNWASLTISSHKLA